MIVCPQCNGPGRRRPRTFLERFLNRAKLECSRCGITWYWRRVLFQNHATCPECGTLRLSKRKKYDRIDRISSSLTRKMLSLLGAPIYHCTFCRFQFRDYRSLDANRRSAVQAPTE